jgi:subtilase family serine protease
MWEAVADTDSYEVEVCSDSNCSAVVRSVTVTETLWFVSPELQQNTTYYWHVRAHNLCGLGPWSDTWTFTTPSVPDLVLKTFTVPSPVTKGTYITITATVENQGTSTVSFHRVGFYTSPINRIASCNIFTLGAGSSKSCSSYIFIPPGLPPGDYPLGAFADYMNTVRETNEGNNLKIEMITIQ